jgi:GH25 family lysozyme M1 (1,4-beta-N-acetylmuramidase)
VRAPRRFMSFPIPRPLAATSVLALAAGVLGLASLPAQAAGPASTAVTHWVTMESGARVPMTKPVFPHTPVSPEKLTHPGADSMGKVTSAHAPWGKTSKAAPAAVPSLPGIDISSYQGNVNWASVAPHIDFSYAKATEGTYYTNPYFANQYNGPYNAGLIRGAYHFAIPNNSQGQTQADYFVNHGGGWSADGKTLPGALDIEYNPYGAECYGLSQASMVTWLHNFVNEYAYRTGTYPVIYSTTDWWTSCTGNNGGFASTDPLWVANYSASHGGTLPAGWGFYTFWQYADSGSYPGDQDVFNGAYSQLQALARG